MNRFLAVLQIGLAAILFLAAIGTLINLLFIAFRPETISVVNVFVGQGLLIVCMAALARLLLARGRARFTAEKDSTAARSRSDA